MIVKGQKRKLPPDDDEISDGSSAGWETQRQFVFSVSMNKYQRGQELPEPSLRRSVLIANTLRQVSLEACRTPPVDMEVLQPTCSSSNSHPTLASCPSVPLSNSANSAASTGRCITNSLSSASYAALPLKDDDEDWGSMSTDSDFSLSAAISSILTALDCTIDGSAQAAPRTPLRSLENLPGPCEGAGAGVRGVRDCGGSWEQQQEEESRVASSYLSDLTVENLFQDVDASLLERDMCVLGLCGSGGGYVSGDELLRYLPPLSSASSPSHSFPLSLNQNLKCLPSFSSFSPLSSSSTSSNSFSSPALSAQNHVKDGFELEHLMEILVES